MARLIVKSPYIKCGGGNSAGGYMRYIATRERVELIERKGILLIGIERRDMLLEVEDPFAQRSCRMQLPHRKFRKRFYVINNLHIV